MQSSRYSSQQAAFGLRQAEEGAPVSEVCRKIGVSEGRACQALTLPGPSTATGAWKISR